jgi:hypothetical protein
MSHLDPRAITRGRRVVAVVLLALVAVLIAAAIAVEVTVEPPVTPAAEPVAVAPPEVGIWYCPVTAGEEETAVLSLAAATDETSTVTVERHRDDGLVTEEPVQIEGGGVHDLVLEPGEAQFPLTVRWAGGPAVATWRVEGRDTAGARCESAPAPRWYLAGFETTAQTQSRLHLFNPFAVDAVARVTFGTPTGPVALVLTDNVLVEAGSHVVLDLNEYEPEQPDLAVTVEVLTGRLVTQGTVDLRPTANQPGPTGRDVIVGSPDPRVEWAFAYARADETSSSWLSVFNPARREAAVEVRVANPLPDGAALLGEVSVPAGGVVRIDLAESSSSAEFGVTLLSVNETPVVVSRLTTVRTAGGAEGAAAALGAVVDERWALAGAGGADRASRLALYNPGSSPVAVAVDAGAQTPADWERIALQPNEQLSLELADVAGQRGSIPLRVTADGPIVADVRVQSPGENLRFWTAGGVPSIAWEGPGVRPAVRRDARLSTRPAAMETPEPEPLQ